jgi:hypothetical protein
MLWKICALQSEIDMTEKNNSRSFWRFFAEVSLLGMLSLAPGAYADNIQTYDLAWSGAAFTNGASATGQIQLDLSTLPDPGGPGIRPNPRH